MEERQCLLPKLHQDVEDVRIIMQKNLVRAEDRRETLDELDHRADKLLQCSKNFAKTTRRPVQNQHRTNANRKLNYCIIFWLIVVVIFIVIIITGLHCHWFS